MPLMDMPLEALKNYDGTNPKPLDFDEFWDKSLDEIKNINPEVNLEKIDFKCSYANCYNMYFNSTKNSRICAKLLVPENCTGKAPALIAFHGYSLSSGDWIGYLPYVAEGFVVAALDCRGQAGNSVECTKYVGNTLDGFITRGLLNESAEDMYYRNVFLDTVMLARIIMAMDEVDEERVCTYGESQGGALALVCAALEPKISKVVARVPFLCDYKRVWDMDMDANAYRDLRAFFRQKDPMHEKEEYFFTKLGYIDVQHLAPRIKGEVLMFTGLMDNICPPSTQFAAYNKMKCKKNIKIYPDFGHEWHPGSADIIYEFLCN